MKKTLRIAFLVVAALVLVGTGGYLTLSKVNDTNFATLGACLLFMAVGETSRDKFFYYAVCGLLVAYIGSALVINPVAFFGPLTCLIFFVSGRLLHLQAVLKYSLMLGLALLISFVLVPEYLLSLSF